MSSKGVFYSPAVKLILFGTFLNDGNPVMSSIFIDFRGMQVGKEYMPISGFPRVLLQDKIEQDKGSFDVSELDAGGSYSVQWNGNSFKESSIAESGGPKIKPPIL